ncbi:MAG: hypothetical protein ACYDHN_01230 [Solirubrobacteraceae bacterium]
MRIHTTHSRDAALRELHRINRWMIAGSVVLTGVLSDVAAHAFPGKSVKAAASSKKAHRAEAHKSTSGHTSTGVLRPPEQAPQSSEEATPGAESAPSQESSPAEETAPSTEESAPSTEAAPEQESVPAQESPPAQEAAPEPEAPVVSGGS